MVMRHPAGSFKIKVCDIPESCFCLFFFRVLPLIGSLALGFSVSGCHGLGYAGTIAASYGDLENVCAIEANGDQGVLCWGKNSSLAVYPSSIPQAYSLLSGGNGFMCGLRAGTASPHCWVGNWSNANLIPEWALNFSYVTIATGEFHACAIRRPPSGPSSSDPNSGKVDCWGQAGEGSFIAPASLPSLSSLVAGRSFTCGLDRYSHFPVCWGSSECDIFSAAPRVAFESLSAGSNHVCGVLKGSKRVKCWGDNSKKQADPPVNVSFVAVSAGLYHSCGITDSTHEVICWGDENFDTSPLPSRISFMALASAPNMTCGIREDSLLAMCWGNDAALLNYSPPLQLFSPGICSSTSCVEGTFSFNASTIMDLAVISSSNICLDSDEHICSPCAKGCPPGMFVSKPCSRYSDRSCSDCTFCVSESCRSSCQAGAALPVASPPQSKSTTTGKPGGAAVIIGAAVTGAVVVTAFGALALCLMYRKRFRHQFFACALRGSKFPDIGSGGEGGVGGGGIGGMHSGSLLGGGSTIPGGGGGRRTGVSHHDVVRMQAFRLAVLRDATNGFKELNELGRGSYGFVYKAVLPDGRQVAVKRANAARRIQSRSRDFEGELEVLCKLHHAHLVNLIGYCEEMGERLLVYEFMPHGTLHDHLHGGLAQLNWHLRLKVAAQAARGIEYLHKDASPRIIHRDIKSSNILLDGEWGARVADFGLTFSDRERGHSSSLKPAEVAYVDPEYLISLTYTEKSDVYSFGVVLLEILCGRKAYDTDFQPPNIVDWAIPFIRQGRTAQILDRSLDLPRNIEPLMRVAEIVELCVRSSPEERPSMPDVAAWLELVGRSSSL